MKSHQLAVNFNAKKLLTVNLICDILIKIMGTYVNKVLGGVKNESGS